MEESRLKDREKEEKIKRLRKEKDNKEKLIKILFIIHAVLGQGGRTKSLRNKFVQKESSHPLTQNMKLFAGY